MSDQKQVINVLEKTINRNKGKIERLKKQIKILNNEIKLDSIAIERLQKETSGSESEA